MYFVGGGGGAHRSKWGTIRFDCVGGKGSRGATEVSSWMSPAMGRCKVPKEGGAGERLISVVSFRGGRDHCSLCHSLPSCLPSLGFLVVVVTAFACPRPLVGVMNQKTLPPRPTLPHEQQKRRNLGKTSRTHERPTRFGPLLPSRLLPPHPTGGKGRTGTDGGITKK